jgi:exodeoxyribonuclease-3
LFKLTSLNLNGIRSATSKGLEAWIATTRPDCICVQEVKAQAADVPGPFRVLAGLKGHFPLCQKKGYSGVGIYRARTQRGGGGLATRPNSTPRAAMSSCALTRHRKMSIISATFPSGSSGEERQQAKFRFLAEFYPHLQLKASASSSLCGDVNIAHQKIDLKNWRSNQKNSGFLPEERAWMTKLLTRRRRRPGGRLPPAAPDTTDTCLHMVEQPRPGLCQQRGLAAGLPPGHARHGRTGAQPVPQPISAMRSGPGRSAKPARAMAARVCSALPGPCRLPCKCRSTSSFMVSM